MALDLDTANAIVDQWQQKTQIDWLADETNKVSKSIVELSAAVTPLIVNEASLDSDMLQKYLLVRATKEIEEWLSRAALGLRKGLNLGLSVHHAQKSSLPLGLRTASIKELKSLPAIGDKSARAVARLVRLHPDLVDLEQLSVIDEVGPAALDSLRKNAYLDRPSVSFVSDRLLAFVEVPSIENCLLLLDGSDLELTIADSTTLRRRSVEGGTPSNRFLRFIKLITSESEIRLSVARGVTANDVQRFMDRHAIRSKYVNNMDMCKGEVLVGTNYVPAVKDIIENASDHVYVLMFLATATDDVNSSSSSLELVKALEARAAAGVKVQVILDQDDGGEPYRSVFINRPLMDRLLSNNVSVKFDEKDVLLHSKVVVADGHTAVVGSHNWTKASLNNTYELSVLFQNDAVAKQFDTRFEILWNNL